MIEMIAAIRVLRSAAARCLASTNSKSISEGQAVAKDSISASDANGPGFGVAGCISANLSNDACANSTNWFCKSDRIVLTPALVESSTGEHVAQMPESLILSHGVQSSYWNQRARGKRNKSRFRRWQAVRSRTKRDVFCPCAISRQTCSSQTRHNRLRDGETQALRFQARPEDALDFHQRERAPLRFRS